MPSSSQTPRWLAEKPLIITGSWDSTPIFRHRRGGYLLADDEEYTSRYRRETVDAMKSVGVTMAVVDFFKCFGLAAESEIAAGLHDFVAACKANDIRIGAYVGSTIGYETLLIEVPEAEEWLVKSHSGGYLYYPGESFRARMYFMHPGYRAYIKRVLRAAIVDFGADEIHFDSASVMAEHDIFYHPLAEKDFRRYLAAHYSPEDLKRRFGVSDPGAILPPRFNYDLHLIGDPLFQDWTYFRCDQLVAYFEEMAGFIRDLNPEVAVSINTVCGITFRNMEWGGVDNSRLLKVTDILWNEEDDVAGIGEGGALVSRIRSYKMVSSQRRRMLTYTAGEAGLGRLTLAESMVYNRQCLGMIGDPLDCLGFPSDQQGYVDFYVRNFDAYRDVDNVADVAVLHSFATMAFNFDRPRRSSLLFQQALIQGKILFDIIFDHQLEDLSKYRVLILPDQEMLTEQQIARIRSYVENGGGLIVTEFTSLYDSTRFRRGNFGLGDLIQAPNPGFHGHGLEDSILRIEVQRREFGSGRAAYIPEVVYPANVPSYVHYPLPANWESLLEVVRWAARTPLTLDVTGGLTVTAELTRNASGSRYMIHLLNYHVGGGAIHGVHVRFKIPEGRRISSISLISPDQSEAQTLDAAQQDGFASMTVPHLIIYSVISISLV